MLGFGLMFLLACHYFGPGVNLALLFYPVLLLAGLFAAQTSRVSLLAQSRPSVFWSFIGWMAALVIHHLFFSISPESSFAVSVALAAIALTVIYTLASPAPREFFRMAFWIVFAFALYACARYLYAGERAFIPTPDPNNFVTLLLLAWVPWAHKALAEELRLDKWYWRMPVCFIFTLAMLATMSRFAAGMLVSLLCFWWLGVVLKKLHPIPTAALSAGVLAGALVFWFGGLEPGSAGVLVEATPIEQPASERMLILQSTWQLIQQHSGVVGSGVYSFSLLYPGVRSLAEQGTSGLFVHNDYMQLFQEGGLLFVVFMLALAFWFAHAGITRLRAGGLWHAEAGFLAAVGIAMLHANFNFTFYILPIGLLFGVVLANAFLAEATAIDRVEPSQVSRWFVRGGVLILFVVVGRVGLEAYNYAVFSGQKGLPFAAGMSADRDSQLRFGQVSDSLAPGQGIVQFAQAQGYAYKSAAQDEEPNSQVLARYRGAIQSDPWNPAVRLSFAEYLNYYQLAEQAAVELSAAHALTPQDPVVSRALMQTLWQLDRRDQVEQVAATALGWCRLIASRGPAELDELGQFVASLNRTLQSAAVEEQLSACRAIRQSVPDMPSREPSWMMRWFGVGGDL